MAGARSEGEPAGGRIVAIRLLHFRVPFRQPYVTAAGSADVREGVIVRIETEGGAEGLGESSLLPERSAETAAFLTEVEEACAWALGRSLTSVSHQGVPDLWRRAGSGVEIAAWDALARSRGQSLTAFGSLGPPVEAVAVNALVTAAEPEAVRAACAAAAAAGYRAVKLKCGLAGAAGREALRIAAARQGLGEGVKLRIDANGAWSERQATSVLRAAARYDLEYAEQPVAAGDLAAMRRLRARTGTPIAADEDVTSREDVDRVIAEEAADVVVLKPLQLGGIGHTLRAAAAAREAGLSVTVTSSIDSAVGVAAALHVAAILHSRGYMPGRVHAAGLDTLGLLEATLSRTRLEVRRGMMALPDGPGLGIDLDRRALARYVVAERALAE